MTAAQNIEVIIEDLQRAASRLKVLEKTRTFCEDWPKLLTIHDYIVEASVELDEYNVKWRKEEED